MAEQTPNPAPVTERDHPDEASTIPYMADSVQQQTVETQPRPREMPESDSEPREAEATPSTRSGPKAEPQVPQRRWAGTCEQPCGAPTHRDGQGHREGDGACGACGCQGGLLEGVAEAQAGRAQGRAAGQGGQGRAEIWGDRMLVDLAQSRENTDDSRKWTDAKQKKTPVKVDHGAEEGTPPTRQSERR